MFYLGENMYFNNCKDNSSCDKHCFFCYPVKRREDNYRDDDNCGCQKGYNDCQNNWDFSNKCRDFDKSEFRDCDCNRKKDCDHNRRCGFCICFKRLFW